MGHKPTYKSRGSLVISKLTWQETLFLVSFSLKWQETPGKREEKNLQTIPWNGEYGEHALGPAGHSQGRSINPQGRFRGPFGNVSWSKKKKYACSQTQQWQDLEISYREMVTQGHRRAFQGASLPPSEILSLSHTHTLENYAETI